MRTALAIAFFGVVGCSATPFAPRGSSSYSSNTPLLGRRPPSLSPKDWYQEQQQHPQHQQHRAQVLQHALERYGDQQMMMRGGGTKLENISAAAKALTSLMKLTFEITVSVGRIVLPPTVAATKTIYSFYKSLPMDMIVAQIGLVYCFSGGYFPTLFAAVQAAQHAGLPVMLAALGDLLDEGVQAVNAIHAKRNSWTSSSEMSPRQALQQSAAVVLATVDPLKINAATGALYTSWLGISMVLEQEFARTINLSLTISQHVRPVAATILSPPLHLVVPEQYHQWVPVVVGWSCKAAAMAIAWRIQRVLTATTSSLLGGRMFAAAFLRCVLPNYKQPQKSENQDFDFYYGQAKNPHGWTEITASLGVEALGFAVAGLGLYTQTIGSGFSFHVPFPLNLVTWPFELAERWIQWQITDEK